MSRLIVNIDVPNLDSAIQFYTMGLGCELRRTLFETTIAEVLLDDAPIYLIEQKEGTKPYPGAERGRTFKRHWTPVHLDVVVTDIKSAVVRALKAGAAQAGELSNNSWGVLAPLSDPFGHGICLVEFSEKGYDTIAD